MTRKFLDYAKSARLEAADPENAERDAESEPIEIRMTTNGFPIIPKLVMEKELKKNEWEILLRAFLAQHYCELRFQINVTGRIGMMFFRSSQWTEVETSTLLCHKVGYRRLRCKSVLT